MAVVIGVGQVAALKVQDLLAARVDVTVVAPRACGGILALAEQKRIRARFRPYRKRTSPARLWPSRQPITKRLTPVSPTMRQR